MKVSFIETRTRIFVYQFRVSIRLLCLPNCTYNMLCHITHAMPLLINSVVSLQMWVLTGRQDIPLKVTGTSSSSSSLPIANFSEMLPATPPLPPLVLAASFNQRNHHLRVFSGLSLCQILPKCQIHIASYHPQNEVWSSDGPKVKVKRSKNQKCQGPKV